MGVKENNWIDPTWQQWLSVNNKESYYQSLMREVTACRQQAIVYPPAQDTFTALKLTPYDQVKVVILGQDPYHGPGQAHGLSFSVPKGVKLPPSLRNIMHELQQDLGLTPAPHGCLEAWAQQGVLLLNSVLTVEAHRPQSHVKMGWQQFTDAIIDSLNQHPQSVVFMLWGAAAQKKAGLITNKNHLILTAPHPSPLSAYRGFIGCRHFSQCNDWLQKQGRTPIDWQVI